MTTLSIADRTTQLVPYDPDTYLELRWRDVDGTDHGTRLALEGRHLFMVWLSHEAPPDPRAVLAAALTSIATLTNLGGLTGGTTINGTNRQRVVDWMKSIDKAVRGALAYKPPTWVVRITRHLPGGGTDFTERDGIVMAPISDVGLIYIGELDCELDKPISIDVRHTVKGWTAAIDAKNLHAPRLYEVTVR